MRLTPIVLFLAAACHAEPRTGARTESHQRLTKVADLVFEMTNEVRKAGWVAAAGTEPALLEAARKYSVEMARYNFLGHQSLDSSTLRDRLPMGFRTTDAAENVWGGELPPLDSVTLAKRIFAAWMDSPKHRHNIRSADYEFLGVGVAESGKEVRAVQVFASK
jgi:uncharacterized protein YkwD